MTAQKKLNKIRQLKKTYKYIQKDLHVVYCNSILLQYYRKTKKKEILLLNKKFPLLYFLIFSTNFTEYSMRTGTQKIILK